MNSIKVRDLTIGSGMPKICVPIAFETEEEIIKAAEAIKASPADLAEWRADWYEDVFDMKAVSGVLHDLRKILDNIPLLMTFRTKTEGGEKEISPGTYMDLYRAAIETGCVDLIDVELMMGPSALRGLIAIAHKSGVAVVASNHDFDKTPEKVEIIRRLQAMDKMGADILKIAVMPRSTADVLVLLEATRQMHEELTEKPLITMSMGQLGMISRIAGETFGSAVTFGSMGKASAPGQIDAVKLKEVLTIINIKNP